MNMKISGTLYLACVACIFLAMAEPAKSEGDQNIKTSYKQYVIFTVQDQDVLCEPYVIQKNDWLYKIFKKKGEISEKDFPFFISIFKQINPHIQNIDAIATGTRILIPLKITDKLDYSVDKDGRVKIPVVEFHHAVEPSKPRFSGAFPSDQLQRLKDYAAAIRGRLTHQGKLFFPGRNGRKEVQLDLSRTPLIETDEPGKTILILPGHSSDHPLKDKETRQSISTYWGNVTFQSIESILPSTDRFKPVPSVMKTHLSRKQVFHILTQAGFQYMPEENVRFHLTGIPVSARLDRVKISNHPDLVLNFETVFGQGIEAIRQEDIDILSFTSKQDWQEQVQSLLSALGFTVWQNPSFSYQGTVETLPGIYGEHASNRLFISPVPLTPISRSFLEARRIRQVLLQP